MAEIEESQRSEAESAPHQDRRVSNVPSGQYGVSDERRAQLAKMEREAGVQHEAFDESVTQRPDKAPPQTSGFAAEPVAARPGDKH